MKLFQSISTPRQKLWAIIISLSLLFLVCLIGILLALLLKPTENFTNQADTTTQTTNTSQDGNAKGSGTVSKISGKVTSIRNLKGLTLRINQIETCNPSVVTAYVAVSSDSGIVNTNFKKADIKIYVDGKAVDTFEFSPVNATKTPVTNVLLIDHSGSMAGAAINNAKSAASNYVQKLKTGDQAGLIQFDDRVETLSGVTTDTSAITNAISGIQARGDTAIYDALSQGISLVPNCGRKAVTILTDGVDTASKRQTEATVIAQANKANLPIFSVGIKGDGFNPASIQNISTSTGGQYLEANTPTEIATLYDRIDGQLTGQFAANLKLSTPKNGSAHTLKIISNVEGSPTSSERSFVY